MQENEDIAAYQAALVTIQEAAKQSGTVVPLLQAAYFAVVSMSDLKKVIWGSWGWTILFVVPAFLWLISLLLAIQVFVPPLVSPEAKGAATYEQVVQSKYRTLRASQYTLLAGLLAMVVNVVIYFVYIPLPPPSK
jgi:hypothetical protein